VPRTGAATRQAILDAALAVLRDPGIDGFAVEAVARRAGRAKGLVIYYFGSRARLLQECGVALTRERAERLMAARGSGPGIRGVDATWEELLRQTRDGTTRAWLGLLAAEAITHPAGDPDDVAWAGLVDGCAAALATGVPDAVVREAYELLCLALLEGTESEEF